MNPINWKNISAPSIDKNSKPENKVDEKNKGFNTYRSNQKVDSNPSTSKLTNQPALIKQASSHITQNNGGTINHIKNSTPPMKPDRKTSDTSETVKANQPTLTKQASSHIARNSGGSVNDKKITQEEKDLAAKISGKFKTVTSAVYAIDQSISSQMNIQKFKDIAEDMLNKSTKSHNINDLKNFKSDLKNIQSYLTKDLYSEIKNSLDTQLKIAIKSENNSKSLEILNEAVNNFNKYANDFNKNIPNMVAETGKQFTEKTPLNNKNFEVIARNLLSESSVSFSKTQLETFKANLKEVKSYLNEKNYYELKNALDSRLKVAVEHKKRV